MTTQDSKKQIIKATGIVGSAQIITIIIRIIRTKIIAVLLGPGGVGIAGLYFSTVELVRRGTGLGLDFSAVRNVAEANGSGDQQQIGLTIKILRRLVWVTGFLGLAILVIFRKQFSLYAFKDTDHTFDFVFLSAIPLFSSITGGQLALLRGVRRIGDMARANILGAAAGLVITVPLYWMMGIKGIVPAMVLTALAVLGLSWHFSRKIKVVPVSVTLRETITGGAGMVRLGLFAALTGIMLTVTMYLVRIFISGKLGVDGVGHFQAAWNISAIYVGLVLNSMGADYFPRLSAINRDDIQVCKLVNEQTEVALLLAGPLVLGMICFIDVIIKIFYSDKFEQSSSILLWQTMGNLLKVISWPMGFILLAKCKGALFVFAEFLWNAIFLGITWAAWDKFGLEIIGIAFVAGYVVYIVVIYISCKQICDFSWSIKNKKMILFYVLLTGLSFINVKCQIVIFWRLLSMVLLAVAMAYSYYELRKIIDIKMTLIKILNKIGMSKSGNNKK